MTDLLEQLRDANPVDADALKVSPELSARVLRRPPARSERTQRLRVPVAMLATAAVCAVILLASGRDGAPSLAARAYAATTGEGIIHWRTEQHSFSNGNHIEHLRTEGWSRDGVTHVVRYAVRRGKLRLIDDSRTAEGRRTTYVAASDDYVSGVASASRGSTNPLASGDPFAIFRRAYRTGKLRQVGPQRYAAELPGHANGPSAIYDLDSVSALPTAFTLTDSVVSGGKRYDNKLVMRFTAYERLPFTQAHRVKLRLQAHPGAGPKDDPAARHFAVLRGDRRPGPGAMRAIELFAGYNRYGLDASAARALSGGHYLVPGHGYVCLLIATARGIGGACVTVAQAVRHGIATGTPAAGFTVGVPDGVKALRARLRGGTSTSVPVRDNRARLPLGAYKWQFVR
jgi:hypothetical protein